MSSVLFSRRGRAQRAVGDPGQPIVPSRLLGRRSSTVVTTDLAMAIPAVWACTQLRANVVSSMTPGVFRDQAGGVPARQNRPGIFTQPSASFTWSEWTAASQVSLDLRGNAYGHIVAFDGNGLPAQIELQHPDSVGVRLDSGGNVQYRFKGQKMDPREVWHEKAYPMAGSPVGLSPIAYFATTLGLNISAEQYGDDWFGDGAHPMGVFKNSQAREMDQKTARAVKDRFMAGLRGREPLVLSGSWDWQQLQVAPNESQFLETLKFGGQQVARIFGVPSEMIGLGSGNSMTYSNREQRSLDFLTYGIGPTIHRREEAWSLGLLPRPRYVKLDESSLLRTDILTRWRVYQLQMVTKARAQDEVRQAEQWPPLTAAQIAQLKDLDVTETARLTDAGASDGVPPDALPDGGN